MPTSQEHGALSSGAGGTAAVTTFPAFPAVPGTASAKSTLTPRSGADFSLGPAPPERLSANPKGAEAPARQPEGNHGSADVILESPPSLSRRRDGTATSKSRTCTSSPLSSTRTVSTSLQLYDRGPPPRLVSSVRKEYEKCLAANNIPVFVPGPRVDVSPNLPARQQKSAASRVVVPAKTPSTGATRTSVRTLTISPDRLNNWFNKLHCRFHLLQCFRVWSAAGQAAQRRGCTKKSKAGPAVSTSSAPAVSGGNKHRRHTTAAGAATSVTKGKAEQHAQQEEAQLQLQDQLKLKDDRYAKLQHLWKKAKDTVALQARTVEQGEQERVALSKRIEILQRRVAQFERAEQRRGSPARRGAGTGAVAAPGAEHQHTLMRTNAFLSPRSPAAVDGSSRPLADAGATPPMPPVLMTAQRDRDGGATTSPSGAGLTSAHAASRSATARRSTIAGSSTVSVSARSSPLQGVSGAASPVRHVLAPPARPVVIHPGGSVARSPRGPVDVLPPLMIRSSASAKITPGGGRGAKADKLRTQLPSAASLALAGGAPNRAAVTVATSSCSSNQRNPRTDAAIRAHKEKALGATKNKSGAAAGRGQPSSSLVTARELLRTLRSEREKSAALVFDDIAEEEGEQVEEVPGGGNGKETRVRQDIAGAIISDDVGEVEKEMCGKITAAVHDAGGPNVAIGAVAGAGGA